MCIALSEVLCWHLLARAEENHGKAYSGQLISVPRFEVGTSRLTKRDAEHSTATFSFLGTIRLTKQSLSGDMRVNSVPPVNWNILHKILNINNSVLSLVFFKKTRGKERSFRIYFSEKQADLKLLLFRLSGITVHYLREFTAYKKACIVDGKNYPAVAN